MAVKGVQSILPDPNYVRALEQELAELRSLIEQAVDDTSYLKGRVQ